MYPCLIHDNSTDLLGSLPIFYVFYRLPILDVFLQIFKKNVKKNLSWIVHMLIILVDFYDV